jgi:hypothetical protein
LNEQIQPIRRFRQIGICSSRWDREAQRLAGLGCAGLPSASAGVMGRQIVNRKVGRHRVPGRSWRKGDAWGGAVA